MVKLIIAGVAIFILGLLSGFVVSCICVSLGEYNERNGRK